MQLLYFGWVRGKVGIDRETVAPPDGVDDVAALITWLSGRGAGYAEAFGDITVVRVAVDQELAELDQPIAGADEIAMFPPMTGG